MFTPASAHKMASSIFMLKILIFCSCAALALGSISIPADEVLAHHVAKVQQRILRASFRNPEIARATQQWRKPLSFMPVHSTNVSHKPVQHSQGKLVNQCSLDLSYTLFSIKEPWAMQMIDSFGKPASGLLHGLFRWTGSFDECIKVSAPPSFWSSKGFTGRYGWLSFKPPKKSAILQSLTIGVCLPSSCAEDNNFADLQSRIKSFLRKIPVVKQWIKKLPILQVAFVPTSNSISSAAIACICLCSVFTTLVLLGTLVDAVSRHRKSESQSSEECPRNSCNTEVEKSTSISISGENGEQCKDETKLIVVSKTHTLQHKCLGEEFLLCFSALSNAEAIFDTSSSQGQLQCMHGIRFISMTWVILGHTYVFGMAVFGNVLDMLELFDTWPFQVVSEGTYSVDTFFLLSGCLLTYLFLKNSSHFSDFKQWLWFYAHRYIRLTPVYAVILFVFGTWWNSLSSGPFWTVDNADRCSKYWWWNLLYINNFVSDDKMCMGWSWYLANDMQFFIISPIFLIALKRDRIVGLVVISVLLVASWITTAVISRVNNFPIMFEGIGNADDFEEAEGKQMQVFDSLYDKPYTRIGPYLIGVLLGYALDEFRGKEKFLHKAAVIVGWVGSQTLSLILIYGLCNANLSPGVEAAHNALARSAWSLTVAWVIFACLTGHAGPVNTLLSLKLWIPLSRLTYCAYLVHPMVMYWYYNSLKTIVIFSNQLIVINYLSFVVLSYGVAFLTSLVFEAPIMKLEKFVKKL